MSCNSDKNCNKKISNSSAFCRTPTITKYSNISILDELLSNAELLQK